MIMVQGFNGIGPVIGILTTGEEWLFAWFPDDQSAMETRIEEEEISHIAPQRSRNPIVPLETPHLSVKSREDISSKQSERTRAMTSISIQFPRDSSILQTYKAL